MLNPGAEHLFARVATPLFPLRTMCCPPARHPRHGHITAPNGVMLTCSQYQLRWQLGARLVLVRLGVEKPGLVSGRAWGGCACVFLTFMVSAARRLGSGALPSLK
jgi:hypothetical protein